VHLPRLRAVVVEGLFAAITLVAAVVASIVVFSMVSYGLGVPTSRDPLGVRTWSFSPAGWLGFIALVVAVAPVGEEVFFRGLFYNALRQRLHTIVAAPLQALVFGFLHPFDFANAAAVATMGLSLALIYEWRKTLLSPILLHAVANTVGFVFITWMFAPDPSAPRLGVRALAHQGGCVVTEVASGSAAEAAGILVGDVIIAVDGQPVADFPALADAVRKHRQGDTVSVEFNRGGEAHVVDAVLKRLQE
jgi:membrane-associated protease RseP (regulator of RpoE activity)